MRRLWNEIDLHVTYVLLLLFLLVPCLGGRWHWVGWCSLVAVVVLPQGRILTRAFVDYPAFKGPKGTYLLANEFQVTLFAGVSAGLWFLVVWLWPPKP